jgi:signal transduction histidine kinase
VGRGIQTGDGRNLSLRARLLLAAIGIVAVSLILSGVLNWALVRNLEAQNADSQVRTTQSQLNERAQRIRARVPTDCRVAYPPLRHVCAAPWPNEQAYIVAIDNSTALQAALAPLPPGDRFLLLNWAPVQPPYVVYDSQDDLPVGATITLANQTVIPGTAMATGTVELGGRQYLTSTALIPGNRYARLMVLATPRTSVAASATSELVVRILFSGGVALLLAILVTLLLARALTRPLNELKAAAEDIAAGNYARRVRASPHDEVGVVGHSFNRMAEAVERSRTLQRDFLANVSHELKTPLTSLIGFSQALVDGSLRTEAEKQRAATILNEESQRVLRMSQELLDLARVESGQLHFEPQPLDLAALLDQEIDIVRQRADRRGLVFQLAVPDWLPPVLADPERVHQILDNLLDNAVKYAPERTAVWITAAQMGEGKVRTTVRNRAGAHPPNPERMFDRFYRADPSRASGAGGVGLGLAISRELATAQSGSLTAELNGAGELSMNLDLPVIAATPPNTATRPARTPVRLPSPVPEARSAS